jgi:uncharacterized protein (DUF849 family)
MPSEYNLSLAPNGARLTREHHSALPLSSAEIAATTAACAALGVSRLHLHVRDDDARHSLDASRYRDAMRAVRASTPNLSIQITTEAAGLFDVAAQLTCLQSLHPPAASIAWREMATNPALARRSYAFCADTGTEVQHILYSADDARQLRDWQARGIVPAMPMHLLFVLGSYASARHACPDDLAPFLATLPDMEIASWTACAFGPHEHDCLLEALSQGGDARIGFENSIYSADGTLHRDNAASVEAFTNRARAMGFAPRKVFA